MPTRTTLEDDDDDLACPLCAETMIVAPQHGGVVSSLMSIQHRPPLRMAIPQRDCCQKKVCQSCLYRHAHSILEEGIVGGAGGRSQLTCPLGCGREMTDAAVRACFHNQHNGNNIFWIYFLGPFVVYPLCLLLILLFPFRYYHDSIIMPNGIAVSGVDDDDEDESDACYFAVLRHKYWIYCHCTRAEVRDVRQYERWSLAVALRNIQRQAAQARHAQGSGVLSSTIVMHCPSPNCTYAWLVANPAYRESKLANERRQVYLWYTPPKPEKADDDSLDDWCRPEFLNLSRAYKNSLVRSPGPEWLSSTENNNDGRYMCCGKCHVSFCGLCRQPWRFGSKRHAGISCRAYRRQLPAALQQDYNNNNHLGVGGRHGLVDAFAFASNNRNDNDGRCCPGCSMFTSRTSGCNHMTCPCGVEWCYVCERPWNSWHYGCVDRRPGNNGTTATVAGCIIS
jgi:IBR domain, a half RING-finger domain